MTYIGVANRKPAHMSAGRSRLVGMWRISGNAITFGRVWEIGKHLAIRSDLLELNSVGFDFPQASAAASLIS
jgi:hypothetical protein